MTDTRTIELILPVPPSVNRYWRSGIVAGHVQVYLSDEAKRYKQEVALITRLIDPFTGPVALNLTVFRPRKISDLDNYLKALLDALKGSVYLDDDQVVEISAYRDDDKDNPRVVLIAWEA
jgi:crossover junction endodeoxyribonuclease RusA